MNRLKDNWVNLNGRLIKETEAVLPITDRGFLFGDGVFTTLRVNQGKVEFFDAHLQRLNEQCEQLNICPPTIQFDTIRELIQKNEAKEGIWRLKIIITGGNHAQLRLNQRFPGIILFTLKPYEPPSPLTIRLTLFNQPLSRPLANIKSLAYLDRFIIQEFAYEKGYDDALVCNQDGHILETAFSNFFWIVDNDLFVPHSTLPYFKGVLLHHLMKTSGMNIHPIKLGNGEIPSHATLYTCNALSHIRPIIELEGKPFSRQEKHEVKLRNLLDTIPNHA